MKPNDENARSEVIIRTAETIANCQRKRAREFAATIRRQLDAMDQTGVVDGDTLKQNVRDLVKACDSVRGQAAVAELVRHSLGRSNRTRSQAP